MTAGHVHSAPSGGHKGWPEWNQDLEKVLYLANISAGHGSRGHDSTALALALSLSTLLHISVAYQLSPGAASVRGGRNRQRRVPVPVKPSLSEVLAGRGHGTDDGERAIHMGGEDGFARMEASFDLLCHDHQNEDPNLSGTGTLFSAAVGVVVVPPLGLMPSKAPAKPVGGGGGGGQTGIWEQNPATKDMWHEQASLLLQPLVVIPCFAEASGGDVREGENQSQDGTRADPRLWQALSVVVENVSRTVVKTSVPSALESKRDVRLCSYLSEKSFRLTGGIGSSPQQLLHEMQIPLIDTSAAADAMGSSSRSHVEKGGNSAATVTATAAGTASTASGQEAADWTALTLALHEARGEASGCVVHVSVSSSSSSPSSSDASAPSRQTHSDSELIVSDDSEGDEEENAGGSDMDIVGENEDEDEDEGTDCDAVSTGIVLQLAIINFNWIQSYHFEHISNIYCLSVVVDGRVSDGSVPVSVSGPLTVVGTVYSRHQEDIQTVLFALQYRVAFQQQLHTNSLTHPQSPHHLTKLQVHHARRPHDSIWRCAWMGQCMASCLYAELQCIALAWRRMNVQAQTQHLGAGAGNSSATMDTDTVAFSVNQANNRVRVQLGPYVYAYVPHTASNQHQHPGQTTAAGAGVGGEETRHSPGRGGGTDSLVLKTLQYQRRVDLAMAMLVLVQSCL